MTDKRIKMDCPFCGKDKTKIYLKEYGYEDGRLTIIYCSGCGVEFHASSKQSAIDKWNCRV